MNGVIKFSSWKRTLPSKRDAFSLMEVVIALGVVTFALVGLMGLMPVSIDSSRASVNETRAAQIAQRLFTDYKAQSFSGITFPLYDTSGNATGNSLTPSINLATLSGSSSPTLFQANASGELMVNQGGNVYFIDSPSQPVDSNPAYYIGVSYNNSPAGFDFGDPSNIKANQVNIRVSWDLQAGATVTSSRYYSGFTSVVTAY
jgi:type II secretory pathway pseudopilin PulG